MTPDLLKLTVRYYELVKWAGLAESLADLGVSEDVVQFVMQAPKQHIRYYMPALRENPQMSLPEIQAIETEQEEKFDPYLLDEREIASTLPPLVAKWYLVSCRKLRRSDPQMRTMNDYERSLYDALQNKINTIAALAPIFGSNLPNLSVEQVLAYANTIGPHAAFLSGVSNPQLRNWFIARLGDATEEKFNLLVNNLQNIKDWATFARIPVPGSDLTNKIDISQYSVPEAVAESDKWHEKQAKAGESKVYDPTDPQSIVFAPKHWDGWNLQIVRSPNDLAVEGNLMNHCVGSYRESVLGNKTVILSLRDPSNLPHVTVEMTPNLLSVTQEQAKGDTAPKAKYAKMLQEFYNYVNGLIYDHPEKVNDVKGDLAPYLRTGIKEVIPDEEIDDIVRHWRHWRDVLHGTLRDWMWRRGEEHLSFNSLIKRINPKMLPRLLDAGFVTDPGAPSWEVSEFVRRLPLQYVTRFIHHPDEEVRVVVAERLSADNLPVMLKDESNSVRSIVVDRIDESYLPDILYNDPDDGVGYEAARRILKDVPQGERTEYVGHPNVRIRTALTGLLPEEEKLLLLDDPSDKVRGALAGELPQDKLHLLVDDPSPYVRKSVANSIHYIDKDVDENYVHDLRYKLLHDKDDEVRKAAADMWEGAKTDNFFRRHPDAAAIMFNDDNEQIRRQFSGYAPPAWANKMLRTEDDMTVLDDLIERATPNAVALFYKTRFPELAKVPPAYTGNVRVEEFLGEGDPDADNRISEYNEHRRRVRWNVAYLRRALVRNLPEQFLPDFINDTEVPVRMTVAQRISAEYLPKLARDKDPSVRLEVAKRKIPAILRMMWKDPERQVRQIVAEESDPDILRKLVKDKDQKVSATARKRLIRLNQIQKAKARAKERRGRLPRAAALYCALCKG